MIEHTEKNCPQCGQRLRFPKNVGGVLMVCPSCGKKFSSDFKFGSAGHSAAHQGFVKTLFELPYKIMSRIVRLISPK
jgi:transposase-like protein